MAVVPLYNERGYVLVDDEDYEYLSQFRWTLATVGYAIRSLGDGESISMHRELMNLQKGDGKFVDHKNMDKLDNRKENLRVCTKSQNQMNQAPKKKKDGSSHSKYKGVSRRVSKSIHPWRCRIAYNGTTITKYFKTEREAAEEYNKLAILYHGDFAYLNRFEEDDVG